MAMDHLDLRPIAGTFSCCSALILLWRLPDWGSLLNHLMSYVLCLLIFATGLLIMGIEPLRTLGLVVCVSSLYSFITFPRDSPPGTLVMGYFLCLLLFSSGVFVASK